MFLFSLFALSLALQSGPTGPDALTLLRQAGQRYTAAKSFHIEAVQEQVLNAELKREWQKSYFGAVVGAEHRYRYSAHSASGTSLLVSDGKAEWLYHPDEGLYTKKIATGDDPAPPSDLSALGSADFELFEVALKLREQLAQLPNRYQSAERVPDEMLDLEGRQIPCRVIRVRNQDLKKPVPEGSSFEKTIWIEKDTGVIRKIVTHAHGPSLMPPHSVQDSDATELFTMAELDAPASNDTFTFAPPATARMVNDFSSLSAADLTGTAAPDFVLKSPDGKQISLSALRGKNVLLDFWATWCVPCIAVMPQMADLYQQTKNKGLVFISIDEDQDGKTAADFLAKRHESWTNFHDDGEMGTIFKNSGLPLTVLINAEGKIVYYKSGAGGNSFNDLRSAVANLGREYSAITLQNASH